LDVAVLAPFALLDADHHALAVDVGGAQMHRLAHPHAGTAHRAEDDVMREGRSGLQKPQDLLWTENDGQVSFFFRGRDQLNGPIPLQRDLVEEAQGAHRHGPGSDRGMPLLGEVDLILADLLRAQPLGGFVKCRANPSIWWR